jgi:alkylation response protein AidB-like acyl-CoA dehydrogenase
MTAQSSANGIDPKNDAADSVGLGAPREDERRLTDQEVIDRARQVAECVIGPNAERTDQGPGPNLENFRALADSGLLGMGLPREVGGLGASGAAMREVTELLASYCGVTTFTQAQHHGPSRMILNGPNEAMKQRLVPELASGRELCAVSFAHLRRPGPPVLRAEPVEGGYRLFGTAPWVTGWGLMNQVAFGATLPDERFVYVWVPADRTQYPELFADMDPRDGDWGTMEASEPLPLCAMNASATVVLTCNGLFVPEAHRLSFSDRETMRHNDRNGVLGATGMPIGCTAGSVRLLFETAERRKVPAIRRAAQTFQAHLEQARADIETWSRRSGEPDFFEHAIRLRGHVITLAVRAAHAAVTANSGSANSLSHPAQRLYREAMFYTIQAQTHEVMDMTLAILEAD